MSLLKRFRKQQPLEPDAETRPVEAPASRARGFVPPPPRATPQANDDPQAVRLRRRIQVLEDQIETVERSSDPDSPFQQRIAVLTEALASVERELAACARFEPRVLPALPEMPITDIAVHLEPVPRVSFAIGAERFFFAEEIDWAERGTQIVRGDLVGEHVNTDALIPASFPAELREELGFHLERSLFAFATELRDRTVEGHTLPDGVTLADLAVPSPTCGDWEVWGGVSLRCLEHESRLRELGAERTRLLNERGAEIEDRQRQVEEMPILRRRWNQAIADLQALER